MEDKVWGPLRDQGVMVIGVNTGGLMGGDTPDVINDYIEQTGITFPIVEDNNQVGPYETVTAISPFPIDVLVGKDGLIKAITTEFEPDEMVAAIQKEL